MLPSPSGDCVVETRERGGPALSRNHDDWFLFGFSESAHSLKCAAFFSTKTKARNKTPSRLKKTFIPLCPLFRVVSTSNDGCFVLQTPPPPTPTSWLFLSGALKENTVVLCWQLKYLKMKSQLHVLNVSCTFQSTMTKNVL